jgi:hypothetical protein
MFSSTAIEIIKWVKKFAVAQAKVPEKALEKTPKEVIPPRLCEISQNASRKKPANCLNRESSFCPTSNQINIWKIAA